MKDANNVHGSINLVMPITIESSQKCTSKWQRSYNPDSEFEMKIPNCDLCRSHFNMIHWRSEKVILRLVAKKPRKKDMKKFRTSIIFSFPTFSRQPNGMQEKKSDQVRKRIHLKKRPAISAARPRVQKKMRTTKWNSNPNEISCKWTLTSYLYSILAVR